MSSTKKTWSLLSRHGQALILLAKNPQLRIIDLAKMLGISERSARLLVTSLHRSKVLHVHKTGRNNTYQVNSEIPLPNILERSIPLKAVLKLASHFPAQDDASSL